MSGLSWDEMDRLMGEDPDDRAIREAHGFSHVDDFEDRSVLCRNGCGLTYFDIASGKIRICRAARCPHCCEHGLPYSAEDQRRFGTSGWCGWCEDVQTGHADRFEPDKPQWRCPHGVGEHPGSRAARSRQEPL